MIKVTGLDALSRQFKEAAEALSALGGEFGTVTLDPNDPESIEGAIQKMEMLIDQKTVQWSNNPLVTSLVTQMKEKYREGIIERAASARLEERKE